MTYAYPEPLNYGTTQPLVYDGMVKKQQKNTTISPSVLYGAGGLVLGAAAGGYAGSKVNPFVSNSGVASDSFAKRVLEKKIESAPEIEKKIHNQSKTILKELKNTNSVEDLKTLLNTNKEAVDKVFGNSAKFMQNVTEENLEANKKTIKEKFVADNNTVIQDLKNNIQACWKKDENKFEKSSRVNDEVFKAIETSTQGVKTKLIAKYAAITGIIAGLGAFVAHKIISSSQK